MKLVLSRRVQSDACHNTKSVIYSHMYYIGRIQMRGDVIYRFVTCRRHQEHGIHAAVHPRHMAFDLPGKSAKKAPRYTLCGRTAIAVCVDPSRPCFSTGWLNIKAPSSVCISATFSRVRFKYASHDFGALGPGMTSKTNRLEAVLRCDVGKSWHLHIRKHITTTHMNNLVEVSEKTDTWKQVRLWSLALRSSPDGKNGTGMSFCGKQFYTIAAHIINPIPFVAELAFCQPVHPFTFFTTPKPVQ